MRRSPAIACTSSFPGEQALAPSVMLLGRWLAPVQPRLCVAPCVSATWAQNVEGSGLRSRAINSQARGPSALADGGIAVGLISYVYPSLCMMSLQFVQLVSTFPYEVWITKDPRARTATLP